MGHLGPEGVIQGEHFLEDFTPWFFISYFCKHFPNPDSDLQTAPDTQLANEGAQSYLN